MIAGNEPGIRGSKLAGLLRAVGSLPFWFARTRLAGSLLRLGFSRMTFLIPMQRLRETPHLLAFHHPRPAYPLHILIVPRKAYRSLLDLDAADADFQRDLFETVQSLVRELGLEEPGYRLIANGGAHQDVDVLHFHLISENPSRERIESGAWTGQ